DAQIRALGLEIGMRRHVDGDQRVAGRASAGGIALAFEPDLLAIAQAGRDLDLDLLAVGQVHAACAALGRLRQRDGDLRIDVLAAHARREILELRPDVRASPTSVVAEHVLEDFVDAAEAASAARAALPL